MTGAFLSRIWTLWADWLQPVKDGTGVADASQWNSNRNLQTRAGAGFAEHYKQDLK